MAFVENFSRFLVQWGVDGTLAGQPVRGIYDAPATSPALGEMQATGTEPQFQLPTAQVPAGHYGATLVVPAGTYKVREHLPDGTGMSLLLLTKA